MILIPGERDEWGMGTRRLGGVGLREERVGVGMGLEHDSRPRNREELGHSSIWN